MLTHGTLDAHAAVWDGVEFGSLIKSASYLATQMGQIAVSIADINLHYLITNKFELTHKKTIF